MRILEWYGDQVAKHSLDAARVGIDRTAAECVEHAKAIHPWENITGTAEGSIQMRPARFDSAVGQVIGEFGSYGVEYFIFLELGTVNMTAMPCIRPAYDACVLNLQRNIRDAMHGAS